MTDLEGSRLNSILRGALSLPEEEREAWLEEACEGRPELLERVRRTLAEELASGSFLRPLSMLRAPGGSTTGPAFQGPVPTTHEIREGRKIGSFLLTRFLARGGMGQVWEAEDLELKRRVALKLVLPERVNELSLALFSREARAGGRASHPNLVTTLAYGKDGDIAWIAQELVEGSWTLKDSLDTLRSEDGVPPGYYRHVPELVAQIADGLEAAHQAGVIHRDLKPQNILIDENDSPKVTDFGLARVSEDSYNSQSGVVAGTWAYMSPEQVTAQGRDLDHRTDVFSLGIVLYELLTLRKPFEGDTTQQIAQKILALDPPVASRVRSQCPEELAVIAGKALEKEQGDRYGTMAELAADLRRYLADEPIVAMPPGPVRRATKWLRRHPALASTGVLGAVALAVVTTLLFQLSAAYAAKDLSNVQLKETADDLRDQTALAQANAEFASANADLANQRANDVLSLSAAKDLEDLVAEAEELWPPEPSLTDSYTDWLERARLLAEGRPASPDEEALLGLTGYKQQLAELLGASRSVVDSKALAEAGDHPSYAELTRSREEARWMDCMLDRAPWPDPAAVEEALLSEALPSRAADRLTMARDLLGADRLDPGRATRAWVLAGSALDGIDESYWPQALIMVAWTEARLGRLDEALATAGEALAASSESQKAVISGEVTNLEALVESWREAERPQREKERADLSLRVLHLEIVVGERVLDDRERAWWHRQLSSLVEGIEDLHDPESGLAGDTLGRPFGWGVRKRLHFARTLAARSMEDPQVKTLWQEARAAILASESYGGLELSPQMGLVPLGEDPQSGLWEFAHLQSGQAALRNTEGQLELTEETGIVLVLVPRGSFWMGAQASDPDGRNYNHSARDNEGPVHEVELSPFFISKYEMTQGQWKRAASWNPSIYNPSEYLTKFNREGRPGNLLHPVENVSWVDCTRAMAQQGLILPTEAQWEYACRAGTDTPYWSGSTLQDLAGVANLVDEYAREHGATAWRGHEAIDDGNTVHARVGSYRANPFGLHEVHGNLWEWCRDAYHADYRQHTREDPIGTYPTLTTKVSRGGSCDNTASLVRSAQRNHDAPSRNDFNLGLRPARDLIP